MAIKPSNFVEACITVEGHKWVGKYGWDTWNWMRDIYDDGSMYKVLLASRQVGKSSAEGNLLITYSVLMPGTRSLYVSSAEDNTRVFSVDRIDSIVENSPMIKPLFKKRTQIHEKQLINGSTIRLRSAFISPARVRGISSKIIMLDEVSLLYMENIAVILQCAVTFADEKKIILAGTPLTTDNPLSYDYFDKSTANEWMIKCGCGKWNGMNEQNIGKTGLVCENCSKALDYKDGIWVKTREVSEITPYTGWRISQLMAPYTYNESAWRDLKIAQREWPAAKFYNEVLGIAYDKGKRYISREDIENCCKAGNYSMVTQPDQNIRAGYTFAGIDWGGYEHSFTVLVIIGYTGGKLKLLLAKRYTGYESDFDYQIQDICKYLNLFNVDLVGTDFGGGLKFNFDLMNIYGMERIFPIFEHITTEKFKQEKKSYRLIVNRTMVLSDIFHLIKKQLIQFPRVEEFMVPYGDDILANFIEEDHMGRLKFNKHKETPDDTLHALSNAFIVSQLRVPRLDVQIPIANLEHI